MPIFDQGYQHWKGALSGHAWRWLAITRQGLRGQLKGSMILRILLLLAWLPALALVVVLALWGLFEQGTEAVMQLLQPIAPAGHRRRSARLPASRVDDLVFDVLQVRDLLSSCCWW